jgi:hypothetical protein
MGGQMRLGGIREAAPELASAGETIRSLREASPSLVDDLARRGYNWSVDTVWRPEGRSISNRRSPDRNSMPRRDSRMSAVYSPGPI